MCEKQVSTENGILKCELAPGHEGFHHASHPGGNIPYTDFHKVLNEDRIATHEVPALVIEWPQEGMTDEVIKLREYIEQLRAEATRREKAIGEIESDRDNLRSKLAKQ